MIMGDWRAVLILAVLVIGVGGRLAYGWDAPLWFDETFSAVIGSRSARARLRSIKRLPAPIAAISTAGVVTMTTGFTPPARPAR